MVLFMITREDLEVIEGHCDDRYVLKEDCSDKQQRNAAKFANDDKRLEVLGKDVDLFKKLMWLLASTSLGQLVVMLFESIKTSL